MAPYAMAKRRLRQHAQLPVSCSAPSREINEGREREDAPALSVVRSSSGVSDKNVEVARRFRGQIAELVTLRSWAAKQSTLLKPSSEV